MKLVELEIEVLENGSAYIPAEVMQKMKIGAGEVITLLYFSRSGLENMTKEFTVGNMAEQGLLLSNAKLSIPKELLEDAEISMEAGLNVICSKGCITIAESKREDMLPKELLDMLEQMGVDGKKTSIVLSVEEGRKEE